MGLCLSLPGRERVCAYVQMYACMEKERECVHEHDSSHVFVGKSVGIKKKCNEPKLKTKKLFCSVPARNEEIPKIEGWVFSQ